MDEEDPRDVDRVTFIVRLSKARRAAWHGVVELVGGERRRHVASVAELGEFIDQAFGQHHGDRTKEVRDG